MAENATTKLNVDITDLKKSFTEAKRRIRMINAEFKESTAEMGKWSDSADGISKNIKRLNAVIEQEKIKLAVLQEEYERVVAAQGKDSKGAEELAIQMKKQEAAIKKTEASIKDYSEKLTQARAEEEKSGSAIEKLRQRISSQEKELDQLKDQYKSAVLQFGKSSKEAKTLAAEIRDLSGDLKSNQNALEGTEKKADRFDQSLRDMKKETEDARKGFTVLKGTLANLAAAGIVKAVQGFKDLASATKDAYKEYDAGADNVVTATGATGKAADKLRGNYSNVAESVVGDLSSIGGVIGEVNTRFEFTGKKLEKTSEKFVKFAKITNTDGTEAVRLVSRAMGDANIKSSKYAEVLDQLAVASQASGISVATLTENLTKYGAPMRNLGFTTKESIALFSQWEKEGVNTEIAFSGMKKAISNWAKAGKDGKKEFKKTMDEIAKCPNKTKAAKKAIEIFGTKAGPDLADAIQGGRFEYNKFVKLLNNSAGSVENTYSETEDGFDKVKLAIQKGKVEMGEFMAELLSKYEPQITEFADTAIKKLKEGATWIAENTDEVKAIGIALASVFAVSKIAKLASGIKTIVTTFTGLKTAIMGATVAQKGLNTAQAASPVGLIIAGVTGLAGILGTLAFKSATAADKTEELTEKQKEEQEAVEELNRSLDDSKKARQEAVSDTQSEFSYYKDLKKELDGLVDANGKVKKGQKARVDFILGTFNTALGTEIKRTGDVIKNYKDEKKAIEKLMKVKEAQAVLDAAGSDYETAKNKRDAMLAAYNKATDEYLTKQEEVEKATRELEEIKAKGSAAYANDIDVINGTVTATDKYRYALLMAQENIDSLNEELDENKKKMNKQEDEWVGVSTTINNYEKLKTAIISGSQKKIKKAMDNMVNNFQTAKTGTKRSLDAQVKDFEKNYDEMKKAHDKGMPGVTKAMVNSSKKMVDKAKKEVEKFDTMEIAKEKGENYAKGLEMGKNKTGKSAKQLVKAVKKEFKKIKTVKDGENFVQGLIDGIKSDSKNSSLLEAVGNVANAALGKLKKDLDEHSPSRKTKPMGAFYTEGFAIGIIGAFKKVGAAVALLSKKSLEKLKKANKTGKYEEAGEEVAALFEKGIEKQKNRAEKAVNTLIKKTVQSAKKGTKSDKLKKSFSDLGEKMISSFENTFSKAAEKATEKVKNKIEKLTQATQEKYDAIKDLQEDLEKRLSDGDLYKEDDAGNVLLTDFKSETAKIIQFGKNMETLKGKMSSELMAEIAGLDTEAGVKLTSKLLSLNSADLAAYNKAYTEKLNASKNVASRFYSEQIKKVQDEYSKKLKKVMSGLEDQLQTIGENAMKGFVKGFSANKELDKATKKLKEHLLKSIKKELDIHSPSGVMEDEVGVFIPPGIANGVIKRLSVLRKAMERASDSITKPMKNAVANANLDLPSRGTAINNQSQQGNTIKNINFYQTNNSPKALSRWEIWRQSRNMLGGIQNV